MKSFFLISFGFSIVIIGTLAAPQSKDDVNLEKYAEARKVIAHQLTVIRKIAAEKNPIASAVVKSIDQDCMLEQYKKHNFTDDLAHLAGETTVFNGDFNGDDTRIDSMLAFANIALTCSNKLDGLLMFLFDNLFSYSVLLDVFRDDAPVNQFLEKLQCYNDYAIQKKFLDANVFGQKLNYVLVNQTAEECEKVIFESKGLLVGTVELGTQLVVVNHKDCLSKEFASFAEKMFLKYVLLVPLGLNDDQRKNEQANFIKDLHDALETLLMCNVMSKERSKINDVNTANYVE